ncbi:hypothetical protein SLS53_002005 [Cytospora paraplurivora]|uniref:Uncharacterized protein n=1 Tax=Cytospora paraplurivora TaxID=2898453 RepID=A0AAN9UHE1_9PEZI
MKYQVGGPMLATYEVEAKGNDNWGLQQLKLEHGLRLYDQFTVYLHIQDPESLPEPTAIGLTCCATVTQNDTIISQRLARVAGVVEVEDIRHNQIHLGMTTGHNLVDVCIDELQNAYVPKDQYDTLPSQEIHDAADANSGMDSDVDSDDYSDESSSQAFSLISVIDQRIVSVPGLKWINVSQSTGGTFAGFKFGPLTMSTPRWRPIMPGTIELPVADLTVFKLPQVRDYNSYRDPSGKLIKITSHLDDDDIGTDEVFIIKDIGLATPAYPLAGTMHFSIRGSYMKTIRLNCRQPLGM